MFLQKVINNRKILFSVIVFLSTIILASWWFFWYQKFQVYKAINWLDEINSILTKWDYSRKNCETILAFKSSLVEDKANFDLAKFNEFKKICEQTFDIKNIMLSEGNCSKVIRLEKSDFEKDYIVLDEFDNIQKKCIDKYLSVKFSTWSFFDVENDFKSSINIDFSTAFYTNKWENWTLEFINNKEKAKQRLVSLLKINNWVKISTKNIILYENKAIVYLDLKPLTEYTISLSSFAIKSFDEKVQNTSFTFKTPENKFFGLRLKNAVSLYMDTNQPVFDLIKYNIKQDNTKIKICRIDNETYAKIEILKGRSEFKKDLNEFFLNEIDKLKTFECKEKEISFDSNSSLNLIKKKIDFSDLIWEKARSWLYYVSFADTKDRNLWNSFQYPIFFWIIDSHITMKISRNWEWFFFVNDFAWNPLEWQQIRAYINNFVDHEKTRNSWSWDYDTKYFSPLDKLVLWEAIVLGKTDKNWILKVNLKDKIDNAFEKTFEKPRDYDYSWIYNNFFVTSTSKDYLTYNSSTWNAWIAPWNFGYKIDDYSENSLNLNRRIEEEPKLYSHIYTDRVLYLPWESVFIKWIVRKSSNFAIPEDKNYNIKIFDSNSSEIFSEDVILNEFGSVNTKFDLKKDLPTWNYFVKLFSGEEFVGEVNFQVEVFKNPKFKSDISLKVDWLSSWKVKIDKVEKWENYRETLYKWNFNIKAQVFSEYYNWAKVANSSFEYKVYKQYYYDNSYWWDCYYWCYWEPEKVFYTQWNWTLDNSWQANFEIPVSFESNYEDYKYIVEVTVTDSTWDKISSSNSIIAKLPEEYKSWNPNSSLEFKTTNNFYKEWDEIEIVWWIKDAKWDKYYDNKYVFIIKKKEYQTKYVEDVRGYSRPINIENEIVEDAILISSKTFSLNTDWELVYKFKPITSWEYSFEYWMLKSDYDFWKIKLENILDDFKKTKKSLLEKEVFTSYKFSAKLEKDFLECKNDKSCNLDQIYWYEYKACINSEEAEKCTDITKKISSKKEINISDLVTNSQNLWVLVYWSNSTNPTISDNKVIVLSEKVSYKLWERAKIIVRLPFSKWKILWTEEKAWVKKSELIDVKSNIFFKEIEVTDDFIPNAYIWVVAIENPHTKPLPQPEVKEEKIPEYKVGYTEIVVDKTEKKAFVEIKPEKKNYKPREQVNLDINVKSKDNKAIKSELTVMVVDDSLISLMWNIDSNSLEKFYKKLPFQIQTSLTNLAMLKNYYFSRPWIVGWSWFGSFKWWDSAVSTRNIFKNTAYFNPNVITDENWNAKVSFTLPDNLTNFRVMVLANSKENFFWYSQDFINVKKNVILEDKTPLIYRAWDIIEVWANLFNNTAKEIWFKVELDSNDIKVEEKTKLVIVPAWKSEFVTWKTTSEIDLDKEIKYTIYALWDSVDNSDKLEKTISRKEYPTLISNFVKSDYIEQKESKDLIIKIPENTDFDKSIVEISFSNNVLDWVEKTAQSLEQYPYWCIEQTTSSTYPNAVLYKLNELMPIIEKWKAKENLNAWIAKIKTMQTSEWGFAYWQGETTPNLHITPYVLERLVDMKQMWWDVSDDMINKAKSYLENNLESISDINDKANIFYTFAKMWKWKEFINKIFSDKIDSTAFSRHSLISYTYWLILTDKEKYKKEIDQNIEKIKTALKGKESEYRYWDELSDKWFFVLMLFDYSYDSNYVNDRVRELFALDWENYYYSTTAKNNAFAVFAKYIEKYSVSKSSTYGFAIWKFQNRNKTFSLNSKEGNFKKMRFALKDILDKDEKELILKTATLHWDSIYSKLKLEVYPLDKFKIKSNESWMKVKRELFEVLDESKLTECSYYYWKSQDCSKVFTKVTDNKFKKWKLYKVKVTTNFDENTPRRNLVIEDYLPSTFKVINSAFNTEKIAVKQWANSWEWNHIEYLKDRVFATASQVWWNEQIFEYYATAEFEWTYTYPPVSAYLMYNPEVRASTVFEKIVVK